VYCRRRCSLTLFFILAVVVLECRKKPPGPPPRYAVVRFENLTGDPALDWIGREASDVLPVSLAGAMDGPVLNSSALRRIAPSLGTRSSAAPGISSERDEALLAGATRLISGYFDYFGKRLRFVATERDLTTGKTLSTDAVWSDAGSADSLGLLQRLAQQFSPAAKPWLTKSTSASEHYFKGIEGTLESSRNDLKEAVKLDPNFGPAWLALVGLAQLKGDRAAAKDWVAQARAHKLDPLTLAELDSEAASLNGGSEAEIRTAKIAALRKISALSPGDYNLLRSLAENETAAGQFAAAASDWKKLADALPGDAAVWNSLGYARSWAGDFNGALAALNEYRRLRPNDANPLDSIGDTYYVHRKFAEAAGSYQQAYAKDPNFQRFGDLYKAAWAKYQAGDKGGADALFSRFRAAREKAADPLIALLAADWLYRTGRAKEGEAALRKSVKETASNALRADGYSQLVVWDLLAGDRAKAHEDAAAAGNPTNAANAMVRFVAEPSATASEWKQRADRAMAAPALDQFRRLAQGYALLLDGKRDAAIPVWDEIVKSTPATEFFSRAIDARLRKQSDEKPLLPEPNQVNQFAALPDKL